MLIFSLKTLEIGKCPQRQQNATVLNPSPYFLEKFRGIGKILGRGEDLREGICKDFFVQHIFCHVLSERSMKKLLD